ncbi:MAG: glycosyltransferase [Candidatus Bathyarchaeia archaeon]
MSVIIPTLNAAKTLQLCLESIRNQDYPKEKLEIIIVDGGSTDSTVEIAKIYAVDKIISNPLRTGEAGKAAGLKVAVNDLIALIDSDNILEGQDWLNKMTAPFVDEEIAGTEPLYFTYRRGDGYITRYCALLGMNDPLCLFLANYDRYSLVTGRWTGLNVEEEDRGSYLKIRLREDQIPTMGANGFLVRRELLQDCHVGDYFFDIDVVYELVKRGHVNFAKVKLGVVHLFAPSLSTFIRKQRRRIRDYRHYKRLNLRVYPWAAVSKIKLVKFIAYTTLLVPLIAQILKGSRRMRDWAWLFHIPACWITLITYASEFVLGGFKATPEDRSKWQG